MKTVERRCMCTQMAEHVGEKQFMCVAVRGHAHSQGMCVPAAGGHGARGRCGTSDSDGGEGLTCRAQETGCWGTPNGVDRPCWHARHTPRADER
eukprot:jgi/Mesvir1/27191/Mv26428-RA.1